MLLNFSKETTYRNYIFLEDHLCTYEIQRKRPKSPWTIPTKSVTVVYSPERNGIGWWSKEF